MKRFRSTKGFTLVEIMIVVLIIGILLAIAVPNFIKARESSRKQTCIANLKQIDSAKEQFAMETKLDTGANVVWGDIVNGPAGYLKSQPTCPSGGTYTVNVVGTPPSCSVAGHVLP